MQLISRPANSFLGGLALAMAAMILLGCTTVMKDSGTASVVQPSMAENTRAPSGSARADTRRTGPVVNVPSSIDSTGATDVSSQLQSVIDKAPNGSTVVFKAGGEYRVSDAIVVSGKRNLTLDGNGATLRNPVVGRFKQSHFRIQSGSQGTVIRDFTLVGNHAKAGTKDALDEAHQDQHGIAIEGAVDTLIEDVTIRRVFGDCVYVGVAYGTNAWSDGVTFRDSTCELTGRLGVTTIGGRDILVERVTFDKLGTSVFGMEANNSSDGADNNVYRDNTIGSYGHTGLYISYFYYASGAQGAPARNVTLANNRVEGGPSGYDGRPQGLDILVNGDRGPRENFIVRNNTSPLSDKGPVMTFRNVKGVTVTGNEQPISSGGLATFPNSTNVTYDG